ncbi:MAG: hypothetical protein M1404_06925 [Acidobacteria bacterium]|nr:hypothetical protein [Acidobacteriota bacterium]
MNKINRRSFVEITAFGLGGLALGPAWRLSGTQGSERSGLEALYEKFRDPDRRYSIRPFWFWNGKLEGEELRRQIKQMVDHGVYGAYVHNRDGLETPYLSDVWWEAVGQALKAAREYGFSLCMVDEFEWPSGEARDYWMKGINKSRVVAANPDFQIHRLRPEETRVHGPRRIGIPLPAKPVAVVVAKQIGYEALDGDSLKSIPFENGTKEIEWDAPDGDWVVFTFGREAAIGQPDHGTVDLMSREAIAKFIEIYYEEFHRRYGEYFGNAMPATFADHEGDYGAKLPWTSALFDTFRRKAGYSLETYLPALTYDIGSKTEKVRCDLLDTVSELYSDNFFKQITDWCHQHNIEHSGHVWEESLFMGPSEQGDFFRILRSMSNPGCDTLVEWGRQSVWLKENASVADFEGRHVVCENQGVQGESSYLSPEGMRRVSNCLGAWNIGEFIPHAFDYDLTKINFPPDWFRSQPYLPWFQAYADLMRRISFVNRESQHVADIVVFYPQVSVWGQSAPAFRSENLGYLLQNSSWSDDAADTNDQYAQLKLQLTEERLDFKVADDYYVGLSRIEGNLLRISDSQFKVLILPPMSTTRRATAQRVRDFFKAGGTVIALRRLPTTSTETGRDDPALKAICEETFDSRPTIGAFRLRRNAQGGRAYFVPKSVPDLLQAVQEAIEPDVKVTEGPTDHLYVLHKIKEGVHFYWVVNDTSATRTNVLELRAKGRPERWNAHTAERTPLFYQSLGDRTAVRMSLGPWDAAYVVFDAAGPEQTLALRSTNFDEIFITNAQNNEVTVRGRGVVTDHHSLVAVLGKAGQEFKGLYNPPDLKPLEVTGNWSVTVEGSSIALPYALVADDPQAVGMRERWYGQKQDHLQWNTLWLSPMNHSIREWNVIGPFPNREDRGLEESYPPEHEMDYNTVYPGQEGRRLHWFQVNAADYRYVHPGHSGSLGTVIIEGGPYASNSFIVDYGKPLRLSPPQGTVYAQTNIYSREETQAVMILGTSSPRAAFLDGTEVYSRWLRPLYNRLTDGFAARVPIRLHSGWNSLLLKFLHNTEDPKSATFTCRLEHSDGTPIDGLITSPRVLNDPQRQVSPGFRWLKFPVPALASALKVPPIKSPWLAFVDGTQVSASREIQLPKGTKSVMLRVAAGERLESPFAFSTTLASLPLGTWKVPGLEHFSGRMIYEKDVTVPSSLLAEHVLLDCGDVGVVAEAWINGNSVGLRPWAPYIFEATEHLHAGINRIKVRVANTADNARAVGEYYYILKNIDRDGWRGPVRLVPYVDREIRCHRV